MADEPQQPPQPVPFCAPPVGLPSKRPAVPRPTLQQAAYSQPGQRRHVCSWRQEPAPFLCTAAPGGGAWGDYVRGAYATVDPATGLLRGPWAECIVHAVRFEHTNDWSHMPEYADEGPVGNVLMALAAAQGGSPLCAKFVEAGQRLEQATHEALDHGRPLLNSAARQHGGHSGAQPRFLQQLSPVEYATYGQPVFGQPARGQPAYGQSIYQPIYEHDAHDEPACEQPAYGQPRLGQLGHQAAGQGQRPGMGTGAKVAVAAAGGLAAGGLAVAGVQAVGGLDGVADAAGAAGDAVFDAGGDALQWAGGAAEDIGEFAGAVFRDAEEFVEDV